MRICVCCSGNLGHGLLERLSTDFNVVAALTDSGSDKIIDFCNERNIPLFVGNPRNGKGYEFLKTNHIDVLVSVNYLFILESDIIKHVSKLAFNIHGSLLPKYRGRTPHVWAIINNETETGVTAHVIDEGCDTGDIISQVNIPIGLEDTGNDLLIKFREAYEKIVLKVLKDIEANTVSTRIQYHEQATYFGKRTPKDGKLDWNWQKERIRNWVRAQAHPYPGAFTFYDEQKITIDKIMFTENGYDGDWPNGCILNDDPLLVKTPNGVIEITEYRESVKLKKGKILR